MATAEKTKLGKITCRCKRETLYLEINNQNQTLSGKCPECGWSGFVKKGEEAHRDMLAEVRQKNPSGDPVPASKKEPKPAPEPAPAPSPSPSFWS